MKHNNAIRSLVLSMVVAASAAAIPAFAQINVNISVAPPALQYEAVPVMAPGYVWAPGYWARHDDRFIWVRGRTIVQRPGYQWAPERWEQRGNTYYQQPGHWARDTNYNAVEMKKEKKLKPKHWNNSQRNGKPGHGNNKGNKPGNGPKHDR